jgi:phosphohistidine swiveling domain-containing protein
VTALTAPVVDPVHHPDCDPGVNWTSGNVAEAFPGVCTALGFTFMHAPVELALRSAFHDIGAFRKAEVRVPPRIEEQFWSVFHGRAAANMDSFRALADLLPGTSATAIEQQLFGYVRPGTVDNNSFRRYPAIFAKAPAAVLRLPKRHDAYVDELRAWRVDRLSTVSDLAPDACRALLADARGRLRAVMTLHFLVSFIGSGLADQLGVLAKATGTEGLEARLLSGVGSDENDVAADLWRVAHGLLDMATFLDRHGYHGPNEGQLDVVSWREDPSTVEARLADYKAIPAGSPAAPEGRARDQVATRQAATAELAQAVGRAKAPTARFLVRNAARFLALREQGKAGFLITFDVARAAARRLGQHQVDAGVLTNADDVFHLTWDEANRPPTDDLTELVAERRARHEERQGFRLPDAWDGVPEPIRVVQATTAAGEGTRLSGVAASRGIAEGRARVVHDPGTTALDDGDILVCEATDPGWVSLFLVAGGVVTDLGGMLSHGAIVAREMGLPAVVGTTGATATILDGQRIRVDGTAGVVEVLA